MNLSTKSKSTRSQWLYSIALIVSLFTFSGFASESSNTERRVAQTEQTLSIRQDCKSTISFYLSLEAAPFCQPASSAIFLLRQFNQAIKTKFANITKSINAFPNPGLLKLSHFTLLYPEEHYSTT